MPIPLSEFKKVIENSIQAKRIFITGTASPDGDSIGSQLALKELLQQINPQAKIDIINEVACPERYQFLDGYEEIIPLKTFLSSNPTLGLSKKMQIQGSGKLTTGGVLPSYAGRRKVGADAEDALFRQPLWDIGFVLDGGSERTGAVKELFDHCRIKVLVDHHLYGSEEKYDLRLHDPVASSTAEIVYYLYEAMGSQAKLTKAIAAQLYLAMIFDTGFFRFSLTTPKTMRIGAELIATGIDFPKIASIGMVERTVVGKKLLGYVLNHFKIEKSGKLAWTTIPRSLTKKLKAKDDDHEGIIENLCYINGVETAFLLLELPKNEIKASFRSREHVDVGRIARNLGGGGHARASGCSFNKLSLNQAIKKVRSALLDKL